MIAVTRHEGNQFSCETIAVVAIVMYSLAAAAACDCVCDCVC